MVCGLPGCIVAMRATNDPGGSDVTVNGANGTPSILVAVGVAQRSRVSSGTSRVSSPSL